MRCTIKRCSTFTRFALAALMAASAAVPPQRGFAQNSRCPDGVVWCEPDKRIYDDPVRPGRVSPSLFASIAVGGRADEAGYSWSFGTRAEAEQRALTECRKTARDPTTCQVVLWFWNRCGALARGSDGSYGTGHSTSLSAASATALKNCAKYRADCRVAKAYCSGG